ncbi:hypothetical protein Tco_0920207 [Tanacetum coccineum]
MSTPTFAVTHNLVAFLEKPEESNGFEQIIDFLNANPIKYALTVNPTVYTLCIKQFWATTKVQKVDDQEQIQALVDKKKIIINEDSIRLNLKLEDAEGSTCLPNATIFEELARMGYKKPSQSAKTTAWNEFSSTMASTIICLANNQKFNFFKYILDNLKVGGAKRNKSSKAKDNLGDHEDSSKQGRKIEAFDADNEVTLEAQKENVTDLMFDTSVLEGDEMVAEHVKEPEVVTTVSGLAITIDELTLAQTLIEIAGKSKKVEAITTAATSVTTAAVIRPPKTKGIVFHDPEEQVSRSKPTFSSTRPSIKDKVEMQVEVEEKERIRREKEEEANIELLEL